MGHEAGTRAETHKAHAQNQLVFQEAGGPRSVSGEPIDETMIRESIGAAMFVAMNWCGVEI
jgi:hypothetical protein